MKREPTGSPSWLGRQGALLALALFFLPLTTFAIEGAEESHHDDHNANTAPGRADPAQLESIWDALERYRDIDVARTEGFEQEHADWPEIGAHFVAPDELSTYPHLDLTRPGFLMYSQRLTGDWELVAVAYVVDQNVYPEVPTELSGAVYHEHRWNCIVDGEELEEEDFGIIRRDECQAMDGVWSPGAVWMTHVWFIPNSNGVFAEENPTLR